jgi:hypothetical protein
MAKIDKKELTRPKSIAFKIQETKMKQTKLKQLKYLIFIHNLKELKWKKI